MSVGTAVREGGYGARSSGGGIWPLARRGATAFAPALFVLPFLAVYAALLVYPLGLGIWMSLHDVDLLSGDALWVGLENYARLLADPIFLGTVLNTLVFVAITTPAFIVIGLGLALALNSPLRTSAALRAIFFSSSVLSVTIVTLVWRMVYEPHNGLIANALVGVGLEPVPFLSDARLALPAVALTTVWWIIGLPMVLFLAALQQIPRELYEAAALDSASRWTVLTRITLPSIRRTLVLVAIIEVVLQFQMFGQAFLMTQGGPNNASRPIVQFVYEAGFRDWQLGYASSAAQVLFALMLVAALAQFWAGSRAQAGAD